MTIKLSKIQNTIEYAIYATLLLPLAFMERESGNFLGREWVHYYPNLDWCWVPAILLLLLFLSLGLKQSTEWHFQKFWGNDQ